MRFCIILAILLCTTTISLSQKVITGTVKDASTGKPLPFATIVIDNQNTKGTTTDLNGNFRIRLNESSRLMAVSYMGYETQTVSTATLKNGIGNIAIALTPSFFSINEVTVYPTENPAHRIVNNAIANIKRNNPDENSSYSCRIYNKTSIGMDPFPKTKKGARLKALLDTSNLMITESVVDKHYSFKDKSEESVIANRVSGFRHPLFALTTSIFQPFHFYNTFIPLLDKQLLNPISPNSTKNYFFRLRDTLITGSDSTFVIEFTPRKNTNFEGLKGFIHINSHGWAIQNVVAERSLNAGVNMKIEQHYAIREGKWFPAEYRYRLEMKNYPPNFGNTFYEGIGAVYDVKIGTLPKKIIANTLSIAEKADYGNTIIEWYRPTPLSRRDSLTYHFMDKIVAPKNNLDIIQSWVEYLGQGLIPMGYLCMPFKSLFSTNKYEGIRVGLGLETNRRVNDYFIAGGYFAYGTSDKAWKYGGYLSLFPKKDHIANLTYSYRHDLEMPTSNFLVDEHRNNLSNRFLLDKADRIQEHKVTVGARLWDLEYKFSGTYQHFAPTYDYTYKGISQKNLWSNNVEMGLNLRLALKEKKTKFFNLTLFDSQDYPVAGLNIRKGIKALSGSYRYLSVEGGLFKKFNIRKAGTLRITALGGVLDGDVPYSLLYGANGINSSYVPILFHNSFNSAKPFEFASNRYANLFIYYNLGSLLYNTQRFKPTIAIFQAAGWSQLNRTEKFGNIDIKDMSRGYFESGLIVGNLLRQRIFNVFYIGYGAGVFAAYGHAAAKPIAKTLSYKLTLEFDF